MYPAITVLETLGLDKQSVLWVGSRGGMEEALVMRREIPYQSIPAAGIHGVGLRRLPGNLAHLSRGIFASRKILRDFQPDVLLFTGGYVAFPMAVAAMRIPSVLYVPDIEPGLAIKALARFADRIALTADSSRVYFPNASKLRVTGYPVRPGLTNWAKTDALDYFGFTPDLPVLAIAGGSKGARSINTAVMAILPELLEHMQIVHLTGHLDWEVVEKNTRTLTPEQEKRYQAFPYLHEMGAVLAAADLIVSRAGASTLGEYPLFSLPAILVPYPHAWRYQQVNADYLTERGAAVVIKDEDLGAQLLDQIIALFGNTAELKRMGQAMASLATPDAGAQIAALIRELAGESEQEGVQ